MPKNKRLMWLGLIAAAIAAIVVAAFLMLSGSSDPIVGPDTITSGDTATYRVDDPSATTIVWTNPAGERSTSPTLEITGRLPGQLTFSAVIDGQVVTRTVMVEESSAGPQIVGPEVVAQGDEAIFRADVPAGQTFIWVHPTQGEVTSTDLRVVQEGTQFVVGIVATDANGVERGDQMLVTSN